MRRALIQFVLPFFLSLVPLLAGTLIAMAVPRTAMNFYLKNLSNLDLVILGIGATMFVVQTLMSWRALQWRGSRFDERPDRWISSLAQAAEWFPLLGLLGTVAGILQTFSQITPDTQPHTIIANYAPAITGTGSGLFMALINILPPWIVSLGRDLILGLGGGPTLPQRDVP